MLTIAVCDDNPQFARQLTARLRELCAHVLPERADCRITAAFSSGEEVLRYLRDSSIHVLFLDIDMPSMGGFELASRLKEAAPDTLVIFVSAYDDFVYSSFEYAPFRFLRKSHLEEELPVTLQKVVEKCLMDSETLTFPTVEGVLTIRACPFSSVPRTPGTRYPTQSTSRTRILDTPSSDTCAACSGMNFGSVVIMVRPAADWGNSSVARSRRAPSSI